MKVPFGGMGTLGKVSQNWFPYSVCVLVFWWSMKAFLFLVHFLHLFGVFLLKKNKKKKTGVLVGCGLQSFLHLGLNLKYLLYWA